MIDHADYTAPKWLPSGNMSQTMQIIQIIQIRDIPALKDLDHELWESIICPRRATLGRK